MRNTTRGLIALILSAVSLIVFLARPLIPGIFWLRLAADSFAPWFGLLALLALIMALGSRAKRVAVITLIPLVVWTVQFGPRLVPLASQVDVSTVTDTITVTSQNLGTDSSQIDNLLTTVLDTSPTVIALQEITDDTRSTIESTLYQDGYTYHAEAATVGVWSKQQIENVQYLTLGISWTRAIHFDLDLDSGGVVSCYAIHAMSISQLGERNTMLGELTTLIQNDQSKQVIAVGDFNTALDDSALSGILKTLHSPAITGGGFGFTWPASFPATQPDHLLYRGLTPTKNQVLAASGSDHRGISITLVVQRAQ